MEPLMYRGAFSWKNCPAPTGNVCVVVGGGGGGGGGKRRDTIIILRHGLCKLYCVFTDSIPFTLNQCYSAWLLVCMWVGGWFGSQWLYIWSYVCKCVSLCVGCKDYGMFERVYCKVHWTWIIYGIAHYKKSLLLLCLVPWNPWCLARHSAWIAALHQQVMYSGWRTRLHYYFAWRLAGFSLF